MTGNDYIKAISKFPKETIIKAVGFMRLDYSRLWSTCIDFEAEKNNSKIKQLEKKAEKLRSDVRAEQDGFKKAKKFLELKKVDEEINALYDKNFKMYDTFNDLSK